MNFQDLFKNYSYNSESYEYPEMNKSSLIGGKQSENIPNGGFPPIYECETIEESSSDDNNKKREYKTHNETISIRQLLESRRNNKVFIK